MVARLALKTRPKARVGGDAGHLVAAATLFKPL